MKRGPRFHCAHCDHRKVRSALKEYLIPLEEEFGEYSLRGLCYVHAVVLLDRVDELENELKEVKA